MKHYPSITVEIIAEERMPNMLKESIDVVFGINWPAPENVVVSKFPEKTLMLKPTLSLNNAELMKQCALLNMGIVQLHDYMVHDEIQKKQLIEIPLKDLQHHLPIYIYYQKHRYVQPKIHQFVRLCDKMNKVNM